MRPCLAALACLVAGCSASAPDRALTPNASPAPPPSEAAATSPAPAEAPSAKSEPKVDATPSDADPFGAGYPNPIPESPHGRVGSLSWGTWVQPGPRSGALPLGGIRPGASLARTSDTILPGQGTCPRFVEVEGGYVCVGPRATLDMKSRFMQASIWTAPAPGPMPYHYAMSVGTPELTKPLPKEKMAAFPLGSRNMKKMRGWNAGHDELAEDELIAPNGPIPDFLRDGGQVPLPWGEPKGVQIKRLPKGAMIAYTRAFEAHGEVWVLATDMSVIPARGLKRFRVSSFHGVELGHGVELPLAWMRKQPRPKYKQVGIGFEPTGETWPVRSWVALTGKEVEHDKRTFLETREPGVFIEKSDATLVEKREKPPWETHGTGKWIHVRVNRGTLTLYEGPNPVFSTLMSPGKKDATPYGRYFMESEHHVSSMSTEKGEKAGFLISDVPWTMYFKRPYAIHATYWHEDFGERKSGGCVNLSPLDAKRVFDWTTPVLPEAWDNVQSRRETEGTFVLVEG